MADKHSAKKPTGAALSDFSEEKIRRVERAIGYVFRDKALLRQAFTRTSFVNEHPGTCDNQLLEFLGDAVLSLVVADTLFSRFTETGDAGLSSLHGLGEGDFSKLRSTVTNKDYLSEKMEATGLGDCFLLGKGDRVEQVTKESRSVWEDLFESITGAIYLDAGRDISPARDFIYRVLSIERFCAACESEFSALDTAPKSGTHISVKNDLQEWCQGRGYAIPLYETFPLPDGAFRAVCTVEALAVTAEGIGKSKKAAETEAAKNALSLLGTTHPTATAKKAAPIPATPGSDTAKAKLNEYCKKAKTGTPVYKLLTERVLPDNSHVFHVTCRVGTLEAGAEAATKKAAEQAAAAEMLGLLAEA